MRKFYVLYKCLLGYQYQYGEYTITLNESEKANQETFNKKLMSEIGGTAKIVITWSLIEE